VSEPQDVQAIEAIHEYKGKYHVLRGTITGDPEKALKYLKIQELLTRIEQERPVEVILALSPDMAGETTMMFLEGQIKKRETSVTVSRLARGLPMGSDLRYADEITLSSALTNRIKK